MTSQPCSPCSCDTPGTIENFDSLLEFERFVRHIETLVKDGDFCEVPVKHSYAGFDEHWYQCAHCRRIWRLVHPDFPFKGLWIIER